LLKLASDIESRIASSAVLLLGCSAGGFSLVYDLLIRMPAGFPLPVIVVMHRSKRYKTFIEELLDSKSALGIKIAEDKELLTAGHAYFAPPDYHLLLEPDLTFTLDSSEPVWYCRPSIDVTFQSVADVLGDRSIAVLLSGANEDGADGLCYLGARNGIVVVQDPNEAEVKTMPQAAINRCNADLVLGNEEIFQLIQTIKLLAK
jgi:two-component system, chemotaxis family, protein-glutamate methylesterase/glutaminase